MSLLLVIKFSRKHPQKLLGIFDNIEKAKEVINTDFATELNTGERVVVDPVGRVFTSCNEAGELLQNDWYVIADVMLNSTFQNAYLDFFGMQLNKVRFITKPKE